MSDDKKKNGGPSADLAKSASSTLAAPGDWGALDFETPKDAVKIGKSYLYRPGDQKYPGTFSTEEMNGKPIHGVQAGKPHCGWMPIQGYLVELVDRVAKENSGMRDYQQFVIMLTRGCPAIDGDKIRTCEKGDLIVLKASGTMSDFKRAAKHPSIIYHVVMRPTGGFTKMKDPNKNPMREWEQCVIESLDRKLVTVPRIPELPDADDDGFDPRNLGPAPAEQRA